MYVCIRTTTSRQIIAMFSAKITTQSSYIQILVKIDYNEYIYIYIYIYIYMYICVCVCVNRCIFIYIHIYIYI